MSYAAWCLVLTLYPVLYIHRLRLIAAEKEAARLAKEAEKEEQAVRRCGSSDSIRGISSITGITCSTNCSLFHVHRLLARAAEKEAARLAREADKAEQAVTRYGNAN